MKRILLTLSLLFTLVSAYGAKNPEWLKSAVIYHIYPLTYMDSNGDGIGDLNGITSRLDYIAECGFNCIWMSPCFESPFEDGGYDITDFYKVDKRFGTNEDLKRLIDTAHSKGIKVLLDLVAGHTSDKHPWFKKSAEGAGGEYSDYYIWTNGKNYPKPGSKFVDNNLPRDGYYIKNFFDIQPALNYGYFKPHPNHHWEQAYDAPGPTAVRNELKKIIAFWCDLGADGFRVDMANSLVKSDNAHKDGVRKLWKEIFSWYNEKYPENIMLSEWSNPEQSIAAGFNIDLLIHNGIGGKIYRPLFCETTDKMAPTVCFFNKEGKGDIRNAIEIYREVYETYRRLDGYASMPTNSHDIWRLTRMNRTSPEEQKLALTWFLTLPTPPIVYYGEEIGMRNLEFAPPKEGSFSSRNRSTTRTPMQWTSGVNAGFSTAESDKLYLPIDNAPEFPNVEDQLNDPNSVLSYLKGLLKLRSEISALGVEGDWEYIGDLDNPYPMVYSRSIGNEKYLIIINPSGVDAKFTYKSKSAKPTWVYGNDKSLAKCIKVKDGYRFMMKPVSVAIEKVVLE